MKTGRLLLAAMLLCLALLLCGCRTRTAGGGQGEAAPEAHSGILGGMPRGETAPEASAQEEASETETRAEQDSGAAGRTRENPDAPRKEYDENASAEIAPGADLLLHGQGEGNGAPAANEDSEAGVSRVQPDAEKAAVRTLPAEEAAEMGISAEAAASDSAMTYYSVLLRERTGALFECQRLSVYWETEQDRVTVHKSSQEHGLILNAGCYDVSARLLPENLRVDDGWTVRKNPGVIVKVTDRGVLGSGIRSSRAAAALCEGLLAREGWAGIDAVKNGRVLLLSGEMLETPWLKLAAAVLVARAANPALAAEVDPDEMLSRLSEEATGRLPTGIYYYCKED